MTVCFQSIINGGLGRKMNFRRGSLGGVIVGHEFGGDWTEKKLSRMRSAAVLVGQ